MKHVNQQDTINPHHNEVARASALCAAWLRAKATEEIARAKRIRIEEELLPLVETKAEGSKTTSVQGYKVEVKCGFSRKLEPDGFTAMAAIPDGLRPVKFKPELDEKGLKFLQSNEPQYYSLIAQHLTVRPSKPSFTITAPVAPVLTDEVA